MENLPIDFATIQEILQHFPVEIGEVTAFHNTSHGDKDIRWNFIFGESYVLKMNTGSLVWEGRLQEISRLIARYRDIGVYCPALIPTREGPLSYTWQHEGMQFSCFVEEFAKYHTFGLDAQFDRAQIVEHMGKLAAKYSNVDLSDTYSMFSIFDLNPFDVEVDEKQVETDTLVAALKEVGYENLADRVADLNKRIRARILPEFRKLPRCVFQGDLNGTNILQQDGQFAGLIDFNGSGTDVNINIFLNETDCFPSNEEFASHTVPELVEAMFREQEKNSGSIYRHYHRNALEMALYPCFQRIVMLFQYPNVCQMVRWLRDEKQRERCAQLIEALVEKPL